MDIEKRRIQEIVSLQAAIISHLKTSLDKAIRIGQLLTEQKASLKHGEFSPWLEKNISFTERTARNYMRLYRERDTIKTETVSDLTGAYRLLTEPKPLNGMEKIMHCFANSVNAAYEETRDWQEAFKAVQKETSFPINALIQWHWYFFEDLSNIPVEQGLTIEERKQLEDGFVRIYEELKRRG